MERKDIIDYMIGILKFFKKQNTPMTLIPFFVEATYDEMVEYYKTSTREFYKNDTEMQEEDIKEIIDNKINGLTHNYTNEILHYTKDGKKGHPFTKCMKLEDVTYDNIRDIIENPPVGKFIKFNI